MQQIFHEIKIKTKGQGLYDFTNQTTSWLNKQKINNGILNINILHTSASLVIQENADPDVLYDLKNFFDKLAPMDNKLYKHTTEGKDDMQAHIKYKWELVPYFNSSCEESSKLSSEHIYGKFLSYTDEELLSSNVIEGANKLPPI